MLIMGQDGVTKRVKKYARSVYLANTSYEVAWNEVSSAQQRDSSVISLEIAA